MTAEADCSRCSSPNAMQAEYIPGASLWMARCIYCGDMVDGVILENRRQKEMEEVARWWSVNGR